MKEQKEAPEVQDPKDLLSKKTKDELIELVIATAKQSENYRFAYNREKEIVNALLNKG